MEHRGNTGGQGGMKMSLAGAGRQGAGACPGKHRGEVRPILLGFTARQPHKHPDQDHDFRGNSAREAGGTVEGALIQIGSCGLPQALQPRTSSARLKSARDG